MKITVKIISLFLILVMLASTGLINAFSMTVYVGEFGFDIDYDNGTATVISYKGADTNLIIPTKVYDYDITALGDSLFKGNSNIADVTIPSSITDIGDSAFADCTSLKSITIPSSVTGMGEGVFVNCSSLESVDIQADLGSIPSSAFLNCSSLKTVLLSENITEFGNSAFQNCISLTYVPYGNNIASIGQSAFYGSGVEKASLSSKVTEVSRYSFGNCNNLTEIYLPESVASIDATAFADSPSVVILCKAGSYAEGFAKENSLEYKISEAPAKPTEPDGDKGILGDVNGDSKVNIKDATHVQKSAAKIFTLTDAEVLRADVNVDNKVNVKDATAIQKYLAKINTGYTIGQPL